MIDGIHELPRFGASVHGGLARVGSLTRGRGTARSREGSRRGDGGATSPKLGGEYGSHHLGEASHGSAKSAPPDSRPVEAASPGRRHAAAWNKLFMALRRPPRQLRLALRLRHCTMGGSEITPAITRSQHNKTM